jgi:hypothetical protein
MESILSVNAEILNAAKEKIWKHQQDYTVSIHENEVEELLKIKKAHVIEIPITLLKPPKGKYLLPVIITNKTEGEKEKKVLSFKI